MHALRKLIKQVNRTHRRLGPMVAANILAAKAKKCLLNVSPAGCGKSASTDLVHMLMKGLALKYTSITLAGLIRLKEELQGYTGHIIIDDMGTEKSIWSRTSTISVLATLVHTHNVKKVTQTALLELAGFNGSAALNIQPVLMNSLVQDEDWVAVTRDKTLRYYHLIRPTIPVNFIPQLEFSWGLPLSEVEPRIQHGRLWYQLIAIGLVQWSYARCIEHIPALLKASAALDNRTRVDATDFHFLIKLLKPMQIERYLLTTFDFESGRTFQNNVFCILVEIASHREPTIPTICEDYKIAPATVKRIILSNPEWAFVKANSPERVIPTPQAQDILNLIGAYQKW